MRLMTRLALFLGLMSVPAFADPPKAEVKAEVKAEAAAVPAVDLDALKGQGFEAFTKAHAILLREVLAACLPCF